jgi:hypothetical protein
MNSFLLYSPSRRENTAVVCEIVHTNVWNCLAMLCSLAVIDVRVLLQVQEHRAYHSRASSRSVT